MFEIDKRTDLLFTLLKCGKADLVLLDDIEYDFNEILYGCDSLDIPEFFNGRSFQYRD